MGDEVLEETMLTLGLGVGGSSSVAVADDINGSNINKKKRKLEASSSSAVMVSPSSTSSHDHPTDTETTGKKRKFTSDQLSVLEHTFNCHKTINQAQKDELAGRLNLATRQVEIWFQNRRARQKQQETGKEYEMLKEKYERVLAENMQLKQERHELRKRLMAATVAGGGGGAAATATTSIMHTQLCPNCGSSSL